MVQPLWKAVWRFLRKLNIELPFDPAIPLLGIYPEKTMTRKDTCTPRFIAALYTIAKTWEWIKKMWYIYTMEYYSAIKKNKHPRQKMGRRPKQTVLQRRHTGGRETHEKMFNITHY